MLIYCESFFRPDIFASLVLLCTLLSGCGGDNKCTAAEGGQVCKFSYVGDGYCFIGAKSEEEPHRLTDWIKTTTGDHEGEAKQACCNCVECQGLHYDDNAGAKDYVLLEQVGTPNGNSNRRCWRLYSRTSQLNNDSLKPSNSTAADPRYQLTATLSNPSSGGNTTTVVIVVPTVGSVVLGILAMGTFFIWKKRRQRRRLAVGTFIAVTGVHDECRVAIGALSSVDEDEEIAVTVKGETIPGTWKIAGAVTNECSGGLKFKQIVQLGSDHRVFDELLSATFKPVVTQDRKCPKEQNPCPKTPGGCACVQVGGTPGLPTCYRVLSVFRTEDSAIWDRYCGKREQIRCKDGRLGYAYPDPPVLTTGVVKANQPVFSPLGDLNEVYLWHGTHVRNAMSIAKSDFKLEFAGTGAGTMYGRGIYMSESCTKADEYSHDEIGGYYERVFALVLCRATLGKFKYTVDRDMELESLVKSGEFDSVLGDREKSVRTFREFVCYDKDQVYPEFVVIYERVFSTRTAVAGLDIRSLYHPQMPIYWQNCHKDPRNEAFNNEIKVRSDTRNEILKLVRACLKKRQHVELVGVERIENSQVWNKYWRFKVALRRHLAERSDSSADGLASVIPMKELHPSATELMTEIALQENPKAGTVASQHLEKRVGEYYLWHGSSREAAQSIVQNDFQVNIKAAHGRRFGDGCYFADLLDKSLEYSPLTPQGTHCILLCRVCCGESYFTLSESQPNAHLDAKRESKHSVVAKPGDVGPLEIICLTEDQAYPEYKIEMKFT